MSVFDKMTAIADAIRGKTGGTAALTLDQMATAIAGLEAGEGVSLPGVAEVSCGEFVPASDVSAMSISHGLSERPQLCAIWATGELKYAQLVASSICYVSDARDGNTKAEMSLATAGTGTALYLANSSSLRGGISSVDDTAFYITKGSTEKFLTAGTKYCWLAMVLDLAGGAR